MSERERPLPDALADVAAEPPQASVDREREVVGDAPDTGPTVPPDRAQ